MFIVYFDAKGVLHKEFLPAKDTVFEQFYTGMLWKVESAEVVRRSSSIISSFRTIAKLPHHSYSSNLTSPEFFLLFSIKWDINGQCHRQRSGGSSRFDTSPREHFDCRVPGGLWSLKYLLAAVYWHFCVSGTSRKSTRRTDIRSSCPLGCGRLRIMLKSFFRSGSGMQGQAMSVDISQKAMEPVLFNREDRRSKAVFCN